MIHKSWAPLRVISMLVLSIPATILFTLPFIQGGLDPTDKFGHDTYVIALRAIIISGFGLSMAFSQFGKISKSFVEYWPSLLCSSYNYTRELIGLERNDKRDKLIRAVKYHRHLVQRYSEESLVFLFQLMGKQERPEF